MYDIVCVLPFLLKQHFALGSEEVFAHRRSAMDDFLLVGRVRRSSCFVAMMTDVLRGHHAARTAADVTKEDTTNHSEDVIRVKDTCLFPCVNNEWCLTSEITCFFAMRV